MLEPNTLLQNRYLIVRQLGQGGMGAVYQATDQRFGSTVALKETIVSGDALRRAFEREAQLLNSLRHAALPHVMDYFFEDDGQFLVMQFIPGDDLGVLLTRNGHPFDMQQVARWADQLLDALEYLHGHEPPVVHRDIKPQNIKLTPRGDVILLDFGLAKGAAENMSASQTGSILGYTPHYAPLEQIRGTGTDTRSDLYSLSATLYHLVTGALPPDALTRADAVLSGQRDPLRLAAEVNPRVPPAFAAVMHSALAFNREERPPTAAAMRAALARIVDRGAPDVGSAMAATQINGSSARQSTRPAAGAVTDARDEAPTVASTTAPTLPAPPAPGASATPGNKSKRIGGFVAAAVAAAVAVGVGVGMRDRKPSAPPASNVPATTNTNALPPGNANAVAVPEPANRPASKGGDGRETPANKAGADPDADKPGRRLPAPPDRFRDRKGQPTGKRDRIPPM